MSIPAYVLRLLPKLNISGHEWKALMVIINYTFGRGKAGSHISLGEFVRETEISKPHVSRALTRLESRGLISRMTYRAASTFSFNVNPDKWVLGPPIENDVINQAFEKWFASYPVQMRKEEARAAYYLAVMDEEANADDLVFAVEGYIRYNAVRDKKFRRTPDPMYYMYAHNFLKDKKWSEYMRFKDMGDGEQTDKTGQEWAEQRVKEE